MFSIFQKSTAGRSSQTGTHQLGNKLIVVFYRNFPDVNLIAGNPLFCTGFLKNQPFPIEAEISFSIVTPECQLLDIFKMRFFRVLQRISIYLASAAGSWSECR